MAKLGDTKICLEAVIGLAIALQFLFIFSIWNVVSTADKIGCSRLSCN